MPALMWRSAASWVSRLSRWVRRFSGVPGGCRLGGVGGSGPAWAGRSGQAGVLGLLGGVDRDHADRLVDDRGGAIGDTGQGAAQRALAVVWTIIRAARRALTAAAGGRFAVGAGLRVLQSLTDGGPHGDHVDDRVAGRIPGGREPRRRQADRDHTVPVGFGS